MPRTYTKKAAPVATKTVRRKPGPKPKAVQQETAEVETPAADTGSTASQEALGNFGKALIEAVDAFVAESSMPDLSDIEIIDLRGVNIFGRFHVANLLQNAGYVFAMSPETPTTDYTPGWMCVDAIRLNHSNKLLFTAYWDQVKDSKAIVKLLHASADIEVDFSQPLPDQVEIMGEKFARQ